MFHVQYTVPALAWHKALLAIISMAPNQSCLPPLIITRVEDMEDISVGEGEALTRAVVIFTGIVVKQSSGEENNTAHFILYLIYSGTSK